MLTKKQLASLGLAASVSVAAYATPHDGTLGATSTGDLTITAAITDLVLVTGLDDIALGSFDGTNPLSGSSNFCVYRNGTGNYSATLTGTGGLTTPGFFIKNATSTDEMAYTVNYIDGATPTPGNYPATSGTTIGTAGSPLKGNASSQSCGGGNNATIIVSISAAAAQAATPGNYSGLLTILISPL